MQITVKPFQLPVINWQEFNRDCIEITGKNVLKKLDRQSIQITEPCAFPAALPLDAQPMTNLSDSSNPAFEIIGYGFYVIVPDSIIHLVIPIAPRFYVERGNTGESIVIMYGTLADWIRRIIAYSSPSSNVHVRAVANKCADHLRNAGIKAWEGYIRTELDGGTYALQRR